MAKKFRDIPRKSKTVKAPVTTKSKRENIAIRVRQPKAPSARDLIQDGLSNGPFI